MFYKKVEKTSDSPTASLGFQNSVTTTENQLNSQVLFTYANLNTVTTPYANLFKSLRLPITNDERDSFSNTHKDSAMSWLNTREIIVAEIPKGQYGELIDGKTFALKIPVTLNGVASSTTVYGSYFGFDGTGLTKTFVTKLNNERCEGRSFVGSLGVASSPNSNITLLYSNEIQKPKGSRNVTTIFEEQIVTLNKTAVNETTAYVFSGISASTNDIIFFQISAPALIKGASTDITDVKVTVGSQVITKNDVTVITTQNITNSPLKMYFDDTILRLTNNIDKNLTIKISKVTTSTLSWDKWTVSNKFTTNQNNDSSGKRYAIYDGFYVNFGNDTKFVKSYDKPVGILYNDKGLAVITDSTLVSGFRYSAGTSSGYNGITSGNSYNGDTNFAKIYFTGTSLSQADYKSVTTEFVQNVMCIAMPNEFFNTNNSTYSDSYDENVTNRPTFITSVGLYNKFGELIGIGKMSEPVKKETASIIPFNIKLKL
jgi:hypothetical protein